MYPTRAMDIAYATEWQLSTCCGHSLHRSNLLQELFKGCTTGVVEGQIDIHGLLPNCVEHRVPDRDACKVIPVPIAATTIEKILKVVLNVFGCQVGAGFQTEQAFAQHHQQNDRKNDRREQDRRPSADVERSTECDPKCGLSLRRRVHALKYAEPMSAFHPLRTLGR